MCSIFEKWEGTGRRPAQKSGFLRTELINKAPRRAEETISSEYAFTRASVQNWALSNEMYVLSICWQRQLHDLKRHWFP